MLVQGRVWTTARDNPLPPPYGLSCLLQLQATIARRACPVFIVNVPVCSPSCKAVTNTTLTANDTAAQKTTLHHHPHICE